MACSRHLLFVLFNFLFSFIFYIGEFYSCRHYKRILSFHNHVASPAFQSAPGRSLLSSSSSLSFSFVVFLFSAVLISILPNLSPNLRVRSSSPLYLDKCALSADSLYSPITVFVRLSESALTEVFFTGNIYPTTCSKINM